VQQSQQVVEVLHSYRLAGAELRVDLRGRRRALHPNPEQREGGQRDHPTQDNDRHQPTEKKQGKTHD
jgi:hypothetical protein